MYLLELVETLTLDALRYQGTLIWILFDGFMSVCMDGASVQSIQIGDVVHDDEHASDQSTNTAGGCIIHGRVARQTVRQATTTSSS